jgi:DNA-3-methyladenine glycosylase II
MTRYFEYGDAEVDCLRSRDKKLAAAMDAVGHVYRQMDEGSLFSGIVHHIIGQQVSSAAQATVWARLQQRLGEVTPEAVNAATVEDLQSCGTTFKKVEYMKGVASRVSSGEFDLDAVEHMPDEEAIEALSSLPGIGEWTAEMLLLFNLGRPDILSYGDLAIQRGMRMVYHHRKVTRQMFERYRRRYSPYGSVASLYLWAVSRTDVPGYDHDYAPKAKAKHKKNRG